MTIPRTVFVNPNSGCQPEIRPGDLIWGPGEKVIQRTEDPILCARYLARVEGLPIRKDTSVAPRKLVEKDVALPNAKVQAAHGEVGFLTMDKEVQEALGVWLKFGITTFLPDWDSGYLFKSYQYQTNSHFFNRNYLKRVITQKQLAELAGIKLPKTVDEFMAMRKRKDIVTSLMIVDGTEGTWCPYESERDRYGVFETPSGTVYYKLYGALRDGSQLNRNPASMRLDHERSYTALVRDGDRIVLAIPEKQPEWRVVREDYPKKPSDWGFKPAVPGEVDITANCMQLAPDGGPGGC